ncbi:hypothetical protein MMAG44476_14205 [Mycolicibacterium mageritense DSM 44476 = CIP 104973]|uniref:HEAT repeat domain-containing protein n=1 Tax=Mycolicibacterium mageritense TaxID=53462 RepID=A0ABM7HST2_MYCME|nr:hypothetical protein [Mycolicibacterium mageritense]BBX33608.1 hypothetical protein MMAGJ_28900 [Mycolicibacterium mageritense]CDO22037.1 hypothetical protein BN978_02502 [Mycolicibacterium mageritense DSM 44476 = CIP 104973]
MSTTITTSYKADTDNPDTTYLVFYREGKWSNRQRLMPVSWETAVLRGDDPRWKFWNKAGAREYIILAETQNPEGDSEFQRLVSLACRFRRPDLLSPFGVEWHELNTITVGMVREAVAPKMDKWSGKTRAATSSPLLREALRLIVNTPSVNLRARRLAAAVLGAGGTEHGLAVAERVAKLKLTLTETEDAAREASQSKHGVADVLAKYAA